MSIKIKILTALTKNKVINNKSICEALKISKSTATLLLQELLEDGYLSAKTVGRSIQYSIATQLPPNLLVVLFGNDLIGYLSIVNKKYVFRYATEHLIRDAISYRLASVDFEAKAFISATLFPDFDGILPEGRDREILTAKAKSATEFDLLRAIEYDSNELRFVPAEAVYPNVDNSSSDRKQRYAEIKNNILGDNIFPNIITSISEIPQDILFPSADPSIQICYTGRTLSLSGFQHKFGMTRNVLNNSFHLSASGDMKTHFVKPYYPAKANSSSEHYLPHAAINEHLHLSFAKNELGMDVAESGIFKNSESDAEYHYIVKMFDRDGVIKYDIKEVATLIGLQTENKYSISSEVMFEKLLPYLPIEEERKKIFAYFFYSFLIKHADMHTKNLSIVIEYANGIDRLCSASPLYDIATTSVYGGLSEIESSLKIAGKDREINYRDFVSLAKRFEIKEKTFLQIAAPMVKSYIDVMPKYYNRVKDMKLKVVKNRYPEDFGSWLIKAHQKRVKDLYDRGWIESLGLKVFTATPENIAEFTKDDKAAKFLSCCSGVVGRSDIINHLSKNRMLDSLDLILSIPDVSFKSNEVKIREIVTSAIGGEIFEDTLFNLRHHNEEISSRLKQ